MNDDALIKELSGLSPVDWPHDEVGERITAKVAAAYANQNPEPGLDQPEAGPRGAGHRASRSRRSATRIVTVAAAVAAATALAIAGWQLLSGSTAARPRPIGQKVPAQFRTSPPAGHGTPPTSLTAMVVVGQSGALAAVGAVPNGDMFLTCVTRSICYIEAFRDKGRQADIARSLDGGATWHAGATLPPIDFDLWQVGISCPEPKVCFAPFESRGLLTTTDGFASVTVKPVTMPPGVTGMLEQLSCPTAKHCVAAVTGPSHSQALIVTTNGGKSWAAAKVPAIPASDEISAVRCNKHGGACIAALLGGTGEAPKVAALGSTDGGASWTITGNHSEPVSLQVWTSCGDGRNCLVASSGGFLAFLHVTARGQVSVRSQLNKKTWPKFDAAVSCPTGPVCYVEAAGGTRGPGSMLDKATLELTRDGGRTWTSLGTPMAPALPNDVSDFLSCPVPAGCIAVGYDPSGADPTWVVLSNLHGRSR
ncbi:MAG TPA: hypothetical protein VFI65_22740 [Streptosporangiaceae bacterium]|nr:hypothetical protein [Streptosporangiaceae bacterium]